MTDNPIVLKYEIIKRDLADLVRREEVRLRLGQVINGLQSIHGRERTHAALDVVTEKWHNKYKDTKCPYIITRGKNKGQVCNGRPYNLYIPGMGDTNINPFCMKHGDKWAKSADYKVFRQECDAAKVEDRKVDEKAAYEEMEEKKQIQEKFTESYKKLRERLADLMTADVDKVLPADATKMLEGLKEWD